MESAIYTESLVRQLLAYVKKDAAFVDAWKTIRSMAIGFLMRKPITGIQVNEAAMRINAVNLPPENQNR